MITHDEFIELGKKYGLVEDSIRPFLLYPDRDKVRGSIAEFHAFEHTVVLCHTNTLVMNEIFGIKQFILVSNDYIVVDDINELEKIISTTVQKIKQYIKRLRLESINEI